MRVRFLRPQKALWEVIDAFGFDYVIKSDKYIDMQCSCVHIDGDVIIVFAAMMPLNVKFDKRLCKRVKIYFD